MDFIQQNKVLKTFLVILVLLNLGVLASIWLTGHPGRPGHGGPEGPAKFLIQEVGFDESQAERYMEMVHEHQQAARDIRKQINQKRTLLFDYTQPQNEELIQEISRLKERDEQILYNHFEKVRSLCNSPEQVKKFDRMMAEMLRKMQAPAGPPHPPHGPPPPLR